MGEVVSLKGARKAKARAEKETTAAANRAKFGRTRAERAAEEQDAARREALLDGSRVCPREGGDPDSAEPIA